MELNHTWREREKSPSDSKRTKRKTKLKELEARKVVEEVRMQLHIFLKV